MAAAAFDGIDFAAPSPKKRKAEDGTIDLTKDEQKPGTGLNRKQGDNLDHRLRQEDAPIKTTIKYPKDKATVDLLANLIAAKAAYVAGRPDSGPHDWGGQWCCLSLALLKTMARDQAKGDEHVKTVFEPVKSEIDYHDRLADFVQHPRVIAQCKLIEEWSKISQSKLPTGAVNWGVAEDWPPHFELVETKKKDAFLPRFAVKRNHVMALSWHAIVLYMMAKGGEVLEGTAPKGPLFHVGKKAKGDKKK